MSGHDGRKPDAWFYENSWHAFKRKDRDTSLVAAGYSETPLFYPKAPSTAPDGLTLAQSILADCTDTTPVEWIEMARGIVSKAEG